MPESSGNNADSSQSSNNPQSSDKQGVLPVAGQFCLGNDLVYIPRLEQAHQRHGDAFFRKVLTPDEWAYCQAGGKKRWLARVAVRLAVKEAVAKALGCGLNGLGWGHGIDWQEVEVVSTHQAPPTVQLHGKAANQAHASGLVAWQISLSHDGDYGLATVLGLTGAIE
jgi:holo-[acyl-carrier protein] synthase